MLYFRILVLSLFCPRRNASTVAFKNMSTFATNYEWDFAFLSLYYRHNYRPADWLLDHNATLFILGYSDTHGGPGSFVDIQLDLSKFDNDKTLLKIYQDEYNQTIYKLNITSL